MHKEILKPIKNDSMSIMWTSLGLVVLLIGVVGISNLIYNRYGIKYMGYVTFLLYIAIGIYVYRKKILKYRYTLTKNELIFESLVGKRNREIARVSLDEILYLCPKSNERMDRDTKYKSCFIIFHRRSPGAYVLAFKKREAINRIIFEPSHKLVKLIQDK